ncbi:MAG: hypothetical protein ACTJH9_01980 [Pseudoalteromonas sp.]
MNLFCSTLALNKPDQIPNSEVYTPFVSFFMNMKIQTRLYFCAH